MAYRANVLMRDRANFKQHYWANIYYNQQGIVRHRIFSKKREARKALRTYDKPAKNQIVIRIHIKPKRRVIAIED